MVTDDNAARRQSGPAQQERGVRQQARRVPQDRQLTNRQSALLAELEELFLAEGFVRFTLDDLAAKTHCSKSTLYALAPSKEQLAVRVVARFFKGAAEMLEERIVGLTDAREILGEYL